MRKLEFKTPEEKLEHDTELRRKKHVRDKAYRLANKEKRKEYGRWWEAQNVERRKGSWARYYRKNRAQVLAKGEKWYQKNICRVKEGNKQYQQTTSGKERDRRHRAKRRQFGFIPLNKSFSGAHGHHVDEKRVIYVPTETHEEIRHSFLANRHMDEINYHAFNFLEVEQLYELKI